MNALCCPLLFLASLVSVPADDAYGPSVKNLRLGLYLATGSPSGDLQDIVVHLHLSNGSEQPQRLVLEGEQHPGRATPLLFALKITHADGAPVELPAWELGALMSEGWEMLRYSAEIREISRTHRTSVSLRDWFGWQGVILPAGKYRMRAIYSGVPETPDENAAFRLEEALPGAWRGEVMSAWREFEISAPSEELEWSEAVVGLRVAQELFPKGGRYFFGERVRPEFTIENVSERPLSFERDLPASQTDQIQFHYHDAELPKNGSSMMTSGDHPVIRWFLKPGQRVKIHAPEVVLHYQEGHLNGSRFNLWGPEGDYTLEFDLAIRGPRGSTQLIRTVGPVIRIMKRN